ISLCLAVTTRSDCYDLSGARRSRHDHFVTKPAVCSHAVSSNGDVIFVVFRQSERRRERIFHIAYILVVIASGTPKDLISHHFGRRRSFPCELDGSSRWGGRRGRGSCEKRLG